MPLFRDDGMIRHKGVIDKSKSDIISDIFGFPGGVVFFRHGHGSHIAATGDITLIEG